MDTDAQSFAVSISLSYNISYKFATATGLDIGKDIAGTWLECRFILGYFFHNEYTAELRNSAEEN